MHRILKCQAPAAFHSAVKSLTLLNGSPKEKYKKRKARLGTLIGAYWSILLKPAKTLKHETSLSDHLRIDMLLEVEVEHRPAKRQGSEDHLWPLRQRRL